MNADFEQIKTTDPIVKNTLQEGGSLEDVAVALVRHIEALKSLIGDMERVPTMPLIQAPSIGPALSLHDRRK